MREACQTRVVPSFNHADIHTVCSLLEPGSFPGDGTWIINKSRSIARPTCLCWNVRAVKDMGLRAGAKARYTEVCKSAVGELLTMSDTGSLVSGP